jgi:hypothetical protein
MHGMQMHLLLSYEEWLFHSRNLAWPWRFSPLALLMRVSIIACVRVASASPVSAAAAGILVQIDPVNGDDSLAA